MQKVISTDKAPGAIGPYSQAIEVNGMVFTSGVIPVNPATGELIDKVPNISLEDVDEAVTVAKDMQKEWEKVNQPLLIK